MRAAPLAAVLFAVVALAAPRARAFDYDRYVPSTLAHAEEASCVGEAPSINVDATLAPVLLRAVSTGELRTVAGDAAGVVATYERITGRDLPEYAHEALVEIDGQRRWMLLQANIEPGWQAEATPGTVVSLYVVRVGCHRAAEPAGDRLVFSVNEFRVEPIDPPESAQ